MDNTTRAQTLEAYAAQLKPAAQVQVLSIAAAAWQDAGNTQREAADLRKLVVNHRQQQNEQRLFGLYLHGDPSALLQLAASSDAAANSLLASGSEDRAMKMIAARTAAQPVWSSAATALVGLYFGDTSAPIDAAFQSTLGDLTISTQLATKPDPSKQLIGDPWFPYAGRYGLFLALAATPSHDPEDFLPAPLELSASNPAGYSELAQTYLDAHKVDAAIAEYQQVIELDPSDPSPDISIAEALWSDGRHDAALTSWNTALTKLRVMVDLDSVPEEFWTSFAALADDAHTNRLGATLKPGMDSVLAAYIHKNGNYRTTELLQSAFTALSAENPMAAAGWTLSLVGDMPSEDQLSALSDLAEQPWFPAVQLDGIYRREIDLAQSQLLAAKPADSNSDALTQLTTLRTKYLQWLLDNHRDGDAQRVFDSISAADRHTAEFETFAVLLAAKQSRLPALLTDLQGDAATAPSLETLSGVANTLRLQKDFANSRLLLEYVFQQKLQTQSLTAPDYLALGEARISTADMPGALDLLHRLTLQGDLYENLDSAASLLERTGHPAEALPLLTELANGTPWKASYRLRLGRAQLALQQPDAATSLTAVAASATAPYSTRAEAAQDLHPVSGTKQFDSAELTLLANGTATPSLSDQAYFVYARIAAATAAPASQRAAILHAALLAAPDALVNGLRLKLFQTEIDQGRFAQARVAIAPLIAADPALRSSTSEESLSLSALATPTAHLNFLLALATMDEHLGEDASAIDDLQAAKILSTDTAQSAKLELRIATLRNSVALQQENASRRPTIQGNSLEQTNLVRPRLTAMTAKVLP
jgi:hypothetical protein